MNRFRPNQRDKRSILEVPEKAAKFRSRKKGYDMVA